MDEEEVYSGVCSNRTFMELKLLKGEQEMDAFMGSNRTFMELKLYLNGLDNLYKQVLIAPLWN